MHENEVMQQASGGGAVATTPGARVLLLGATGRTGSRVLTQLLERGVAVRVIVRSAAGLPEAARDHAGLEVLVADLLSVPEDELRAQLDGCSAVISCLGHNLNARGMFGKPRDLVAQAVKRVVRAASSASVSAPLRVVLMSTVAVNPCGRKDSRRGAGEKAFLATIRAVLPPARDNQLAADVLACDVGSDNAAIEWVGVRPDTLTDGDITEYDVHDELVDSLFAPGKTNMANVAHFMCELVTSDEVWERWRGGFPVIVNADGVDER